jgi:hypothetical protein
MDGSSFDGLLPSPEYVGVPLEQQKYPRAIAGCDHTIDGFNDAATLRHWPPTGLQIITPYGVLNA